jgi:hypothetical protein
VPRRLIVEAPQRRARPCYSGAVRARLSVWPRRSHAQPRVTWARSRARVGDCLPASVLRCGREDRAMEVVYLCFCDMDQFPSVAHLASWVGMCPGSCESAGKRLSGKTRMGSASLRRDLCQAAWVCRSTSTVICRPCFSAPRRSPRHEARDHGRRRRDPRHRPPSDLLKRKTSHVGPDYFLIAGAQTSCAARW